jgi:putative ATPase
MEIENTLFSQNPTETPLAQQSRPTSWQDLVGQKHFLNPSFKRLIESDRWTGLIFWGPPGTGKTSLAKLVAQVTDRTFHTMSAVTSGIKDIRPLLEQSQKDLYSGRKAHVLFIDEIHRFNKSQQDILLPYLESGAIRFIGATTENPSFEVNNAIASRSLIFHFLPLETEDLINLVKKALEKMGKGFLQRVEPEVIDQIAKISLGDARRALTLTDHLILCAKPEGQITKEDLKELSHAQSIYYDKNSESHYDTISAFIKSVRGSDPDAALYYLARMLEAGEDPLFVARRLMILASEDIGNASPMGLVLATNAFTAVHAIGMPEARIILAQVTTYLACAEKSNRSYQGIEAAIQTVKEMGNLEIPMAIRNAPTKAMKEWGYGKDYKYAHNFDDAWAEMTFLPEKIKEKKFYLPSNRGVEKNFVEIFKKRGKGSQIDS